MDVPTFEIAKLELKPGDVLVVRCRGTLSDQQAEETVKHVRGILDDAGHVNKVMLIDDNVSLQTLRVELDGNAYFNADTMREMVERLVAFQRDGGRFIVGGAGGAQ